MAVKPLSLSELRKEVRAARDRVKGNFLARFFKTGKGQYGYGDVFYGLTVPQSRTLAKKYSQLPLTAVKTLLYSKVHEERLIALLLLVHRFETGDEKGQREIFDFYLAHIARVNNWDLVDLSAAKIVGAYLYTRHRKVLYRLVRSQHLWERRIAMVATYYFICRKESADTFRLAERLLEDREDLMHKAAGWMLREVGKRCSEAELKAWLNAHASRMPRTMLRYAIERLSPVERRQYLQT